MLGLRVARKSLVSRGFAIFEPMNEYGPSYYEWLQYRRDVKAARKRATELYKQKQEALDLDEISTLA
jgi:hypothetical protein